MMVDREVQVEPLWYGGCDAMEVVVIWVYGAIGVMMTGVYGEMQLVVTSGLRKHGGCGAAGL